MSDSDVISRVSDPWAAAALERWLSGASDDERAEIELLASEDPAELADAFRSTLAFGTGGLRGRRGIGPNRMNVRTVGQATQGLADYLNAHFDSPTVAICRDSRHDGDVFVQRVADVLAANGITSYCYPRPEPTPALSFAVRHLGCSAGVNVTASHNPSEYSGYKAYGADGCQIVTRMAADIQSAIDATDPFDDVKSMPHAEAVAGGLARDIDDAVLDAYQEAVLAQSTGQDVSGLELAYTPLNGTGLECVSGVLASVGVAAEHLHVVGEQAVPDGDFATCPYPNPEVPEALELGLDLARETASALLVANDPDADRLGVAVRHGGEMVLLTGNEVGMLLTDFLVRRATDAGCDLGRKIVWTTVVSAPMLDAMALAEGFELRRSLTGFKYAGEQIALLESAGRAGDFLFGFEESYGYLAGTHARDKDAVVATMLVCELAAHWAERGRDLVEAMEGLYERYGWWDSQTISVAYEGGEGAARMAAIMEGLHAAPPSEVAGLAVEEVVDYADGVEMPVIGGSSGGGPGAGGGSGSGSGAGGGSQVLPASDLVELRLAGSSRVLVRPSGTEPKIKAYVHAAGTSRAAASELGSRLEEAARALLS